MSARTFLGSPLNVADQGAYENTFLHASQLNWEPVQGEKGATGLTEGPAARGSIWGSELAGLCMFRMKYPPNYRVRAHFHWMAEHTCVLEGEAYFGLGEGFGAFRAEITQTARRASSGRFKGTTAIPPHGTAET